MKPIKATAYRGQHGSRDAGAIQSHLPAITFCTLDEAITYARPPNNRRDQAVDPHVVSADLVINKPLPMCPNDPFISVCLVLDIMGRSAGKAFCLKNADWILSTNNWDENFKDDFRSLQEVFDQAPERLEQLYFYSYIALDDAAFVKAALAKGYDGCAHGDSALMTEYMVFKADQIQVKDILDLGAACELRHSLNAVACESEVPLPASAPKSPQSTWPDLSP